MLLQLDHFESAPSLSTNLLKGRKSCFERWIQSSPCASALTEPEKETVLLQHHIPSEIVQNRVEWHVLEYGVSLEQGGECIRIMRGLEDCRLPDQLNVGSHGGSSDRMLLTVKRTCALVAISNKRAPSERRTRCRQRRDGRSRRLPSGLEAQA
uniref:Uncharacterized protein n=1 Tax=Rhizobium leguminosarum TaxID=384 RepID=A0A179BPG0_RHILE|nr:hypothetical protein A4U53_23920 [Rhizobium leguminosarum]